ncbi:hypothetical protein [Sphingomonas sp. Leaf242]|uniref:hypothetical protein n=1 Tax=Sphingomonas sp. Leaf242 TaxID=1736304 RepID=UPI0019109D27|nr:hypothetical protein [Sphingomonas sp. Leaf242]
MSFDLKLDDLMRRKRELSRGLLLPGEDERDASSLFDEVLGAGTRPAEADTPPTGEVVAPAAEPATVAPPRPTLSARVTAKPETPKVDWPARMVFQPKIRHNLDIFAKPVADQPLADLSIRDPYGCADGRNRQCLIDFMALLVAAARHVGEITVVSFDADSVDRYAAES